MLLAVCCFCCFCLFLLFLPIFHVILVVRCMHVHLFDNLYPSSQCITILYQSIHLFLYRNNSGVKNTYLIYERNIFHADQFHSIQFIVAYYDDYYFLWWCIFIVKLLFIIIDGSKNEHHECCSSVHMNMNG